MSMEQRAIESRERSPDTFYDAPVGKVKKTGLLAKKDNHKIGLEKIKRDRELRIITGQDMITDYSPIWAPENMMIDIDDEEMYPVLSALSGKMLLKVLYTFQFALPDDLLLEAVLPDTLLSDILADETHKDNHDPDSWLYDSDHDMPENGMTAFKRCWHNNTRRDGRRVSGINTKMHRLMKTNQGNKLIIKNNHDSNLTGRIMPRIEELGIVSMSSVVSEMIRDNNIYTYLKRYDFIKGKVKTETKTITKGFKEHTIEKKTGYEDYEKGSMLILNNIMRQLNDQNLYLLLGPDSKVSITADPGRGYNMLNPSDWHFFEPANILLDPRMHILFKCISSNISNYRKDLDYMETDIESAISQLQERNLINRRGNSLKITPLGNDYVTGYIDEISRGIEIEFPYVFIDNKLTKDTCTITLPGFDRWAHLHNFETYQPDDEPEEDDTESNAQRHIPQYCRRTENGLMIL